MSFKKKMMLLLLAFFILAACTTTIIQAPTLLELTRPVSLQKATERAAKHLLPLVQRERSWRSDWVATRILVLPTYQEKTRKILEPSQQIQAYLQQQATAFKGIQLVTHSTQGEATVNYELHSTMRMTTVQGREKLVFSMWMQEPESKRILSTVSSAVQLERPLLKPSISQQLPAQTWLKALQEASRLVMNRAKQDRSWYSQLAPTQLLLVPIYDANSKENLNLMGDLQAQLQTHSGAAIKIALISQSLLPQAHYLVHSALAVDKNSQGAMYDLNLWLREAKTGRLVAYVHNKVFSQGLPYTLTAEAKDSPVYPEPLNPNAEGFDLRQEMQRPHYPSRLKLEAILADAAKAYASAHYAQALELYEAANAIKEVQSLRSLAGRYLTLLRMNRTAEARRAFADLIQSGFKHSPMLTFKILFAVDSTQFAGGHFLSSQYQVWIEELAQYLKHSQRCLLIAGHSSHSGSAAYNLKLSTSRASGIRQLMVSKQGAVKTRTQAEGKGFYENIIGTGTDDLRDAVDRRVEFRQQTCQP